MTCLDTMLLKYDDVWMQMEHVKDLSKTSLDVFNLTYHVAKRFQPHLTWKFVFSGIHLVI